MHYKHRAWPLLVALLLQLLGTSAFAQDDIRELHRRISREMTESIRSGLVLKGVIDQNGSPGSFEAFFYDGEYLIRERFGDLESVSYKSKEGVFSGGNHSLPYRIEPGDSPASTALGMISSGSYLEDPLWEQFTYVGEQAGAYRFRFTPEGLPPVDVLLYSDDEAPEYLQLMSTEVGLAPEDSHSIRHRSFYYYSVDSDGKLYTSRETGREIDHRGLTVNASDYKVESVERVSQRPAELTFDTRRLPLGGAGAELSGPVTIPVDTQSGYFLVPVTFQDGTTHRFILDTGASASLLAPGAAQAAGLQTSVVTTAHGHGTRQEFELGMVRGAKLGLGDGDQVELQPFPATRIPASSRDVLEAMNQYGCSGILGLSPFHQYVVTLDHAAKQLILHPQQLFDPASSLPVGKLTYSIDAEDLVYVTARINDQLIGKIALDTGLQQDLALLKETMELSGLTFQKVGEATNTVIGGKKDFDYVNVPSFDLGPLRLQDKVATITEDDRGSLVARRILGFIGLPLFIQARITLDLFSERMYIEPPPALVDAMLSELPDLFQGLADDKYATPTGPKAPVPFGGPTATHESKTSDAATDLDQSADQVKSEASSDDDGQS
jgi:hypothetical protein